MNEELWIISVILCSAMLLSIVYRKLDIAGALTGGLIGMLLFAGAGFHGVAMAGAFFLLGSAATSLKMKAKVDSGLAEANYGRRTAAQVVANAGVAAILAVLARTFPSNANLFTTMLSASFAAAAADTLSSELGNIYGRRFYNILGFRTGTRGGNGVVSLEGSLFGIAGSSSIAIIYVMGYGWNAAFFWIIIAGTVGNVADSVLGATLERMHYLDNNQVNFLNTLVAALAAMLLFMW
ncbi:MAG: DUF92 domain-containing protein [Chitinophagaceae bacterium]